jgi:hypothetical protein
MAGFKTDRRRAALSGARQVLLASVVAAPLLGATPALAQWFSDPPLPPQTIARIVARHGFTGFSPPRLAGDVYILQAIGEDGARVRLVVDAYSGRILRPLGAAAEAAPPRPVHRLRPWDYAPVPEDEDDDDEDEEREPSDRFRGPRLGREDLVPPRPIGRAPSPDLPLSREAEIDLDREPVPPFRSPSVEREQRPASPLRTEPARKAARIEAPARQGAGPTAPARPRPADRATPASPAAPAPVVETPQPPEVKTDAKPAATAAVPAPGLAKEEAPPPAPAAPARTQEAAKPDGSGQAPVSAPKQAADAQATSGQPPATASASPAPTVRVIEGVTLIQPQSPAPADKGPWRDPDTPAR